jgi:hypothetical protein
MMLSISKIISSTIFAIVHKFFSFLSPSRSADAHERVGQRACCGNFFINASHHSARLIRFARQTRPRDFHKAFLSNSIHSKLAFCLELSSADNARPTNTTMKNPHVLLKRMHVLGKVGTIFCAYP